jgi:zinc protease
MYQIVDQLDALGSTVSTDNTLDQSFVRLETLPANLRPALDIFADVVLNPSFPADMFAISKKQRLAAIRQEKASPIPSVTRIIGKLLYGEGHAYGSPLTGSGYEPSVNATTREDLAAWHRAWFHPNNSVIVVTGDITMDRLKPELERVFGGWQKGTPPAKRIDNVARTVGKKVYLIDKPDAPQSVIVAAHVTEAGGAPEDIAIETAMRNFGGMATSRLNRNLRLEKHWSYGTRGGVSGARGQRPFMVIAPVQTDKTKESIVEVIKELRGIAGERPIAGEEYTNLMRGTVSRLPARFETLASLESAAFHMVNLNLPADYWSSYAQNVRTLTEADLGSASKKFVRPDDVIWVIVGDLRKVEAGIRELNLGEITKLDPAGL